MQIANPKYLYYAKALLCYNARRHEGITYEGIKGGFSHGREVV